MSDFGQLDEILLAVADLERLVVKVAQQERSAINYPFLRYLFDHELREIQAALAHIREDVAQMVHIRETDRALADMGVPLIRRQERKTSDTF